MDVSKLMNIQNMLNKTRLILEEREEDVNIQNLFGWIVEGLLLVIVALTGVIGNIFCIIGFAVKRNKGNFHYLMLATAVFELLYISNAAALFSVPHMYVRLSKQSGYKRLTTILLPLAHVGLTGSIYFTLAIAIERYTTVFHPFFKFSRKIRIGRFIAVIVIFSLLYNIPKFFELTLNTKRTRPNQRALMMNFLQMRSNQNVSTPNLSLLAAIANQQSSNITVTEIVPTSLRLDPIYVKVYLTYMNLIINGLVPMSIITVINFRIYTRIKNLTQQNERRGSVAEVRHTQASLIIALVFIICHAVRWVPNIWEFTQTDQNQVVTWPNWAHKISQVSHLLTVFNSSVNFYIYLIKHGKREFRSIGAELTNRSTGTTERVESHGSNKIRDRATKIVPTEETRV